MKLLTTLALTTVLAAGIGFTTDAQAAHAKPPGTADTHCRDQAKQQKLKGIDRRAFIQKCRADTNKK